MVDVKLNNEFLRKLLGQAEAALKEADEKYDEIGKHEMLYEENKPKFARIHTRLIAVLQAITKEVQERHAEYEKKAWYPKPKGKR